MEKQRNEIDIYRDTSVRYLGYANEVGEAFRSVIPKSIVWGTYVLASGYVLADTCDKGAKVYQDASWSHKIKNTVLSTMDTLLWQAFASIIIPGFTVNRICATIQSIQKRSTNVRLRNRWVPTLVGLVSIPFIIGPIDHAVERCMDFTYRQWTGFCPKTQFDRRTQQQDI